MTATARSPLEHVSYEDLYRRWERGGWSATELDLATDREQWKQAFTEPERRAALWNYTMFLHGEDAVTDSLGAFIDAAPLVAQRHFLATQQVDEARHTVLFGRFMREVARLDGDLSGTLTATRPELNWGFRKTFALLARVTDELRADRSAPALARAVTMYHLVVEATLAQPGQHFIERYLTTRDVLPGFRAGIANVALDEQRHIAFGVLLLRDLTAGDPGCREAVADLLREAQRYMSAVFVPPGFDTRYAECFGFTLEEIFAEGVRSLTARLRSAGLPLDTLPGGPVWPPELTAEEIARRALALLRAGILGARRAAPGRDPEVLELFWDLVRNAVDPRRAPRARQTIQWEFTDAPPWLLTVGDGPPREHRGRAEAPDLTLRCSWGDWVDIVMWRLDPRRALLEGRLRPRGSLRTLWRLQGLFGPRRAAPPG